MMLYGEVLVEPNGVRVSNKFSVKKPFEKFLLRVNICGVKDFEVVIYHFMIWPCMVKKISLFWVLHLFYAEVGSAWSEPWEVYSARLSSLHVWMFS